VALALASSSRDRAIRPGTVAVGEIGLLGELRGVTGLERRLREAARLGFDRAIVPAGASDASLAVDGIDLVPVANVRAAIEHALSDGRAPRGEPVPAMLG
jgi:DNA repair protein RadA/Sms